MQENYEKSFDQMELKIACKPIFPLNQHTGF